MHITNIHYIHYRIKYLITLSAPSSGKVDMLFCILNKFLNFLSAAMKVWTIRSHSFSLLTHELHTCSGNPSPSRTYNRVLVLVCILMTVNATKMAHNELGLFPKVYCPFIAVTHTWHRLYQFQSIKNTTFNTNISKLDK